MSDCGNTGVMRETAQSHRMRGSWPDPQQGGGNSVCRGHLITGSQSWITKPLLPTQGVPELPGMSATLQETGARQCPSWGWFSHLGWEIGCEDV